MWTRTSARIKGLVSMFLGMGSYRPAGIVTDTLKAEWKLTFRRVAEKKVLDNPEEITTYSWRHMALTLAQLLECRPEEMAALGDWQNKGNQPEVGQMAFHYLSAKYAASIKIKSLVWGAASKLTNQLSWEAIPKEELDEARSHGLAEAERLLRQDRQPIWASSQKFEDVRKRLKLSQQFMEAAEKAPQEAEAAASPLMPDQLGGKVLTATLKNGKALCPKFHKFGSDSSAQVPEICNLPGGSPVAIWALTPWLMLVIVITEGF